MDRQKIRVAHIITRMDRGGAPDIVRILFKKLDPSVFDLTLIYGPTQHPSGKTKEFLNELHGNAIMISSLRRAINPFFDCLAFLELVAVLQKNNFDIVHTHTAKAGFLGRMSAKFVGVPSVIYSAHGHDFYGYFGRLGSRMVVWAERLAALCCDKMHVLTLLEKNDMVSFKICPPEKLEVISSGVELDIYRRNKEKKPEDMWVGFVGRLEPIKGPQYLIEAAKIVVVKKPGVRFLVAGDGSLRVSLEKQAAELGLAGNFKFLGWREDVEELLPILDILVLPSLNEAVARSVLEAQAAGVPVVASRVGGVPEVVKDGETGILVDAKNSQKLAEAILILLNDDQRRMAMSKAAIQWVDEKFSDRVMVEKFEELYRKLYYNRMGVKER